MKIKIDDVIPVYDSHNLYSEGFGRKIHIMNNKTGRCLCGYEPNCYNSVLLDGNPFNNIIEYVAQPDPDRNICQRCKEILVDKIEI